VEERVHLHAILVEVVGIHLHVLRVEGLDQKVKDRVLEAEVGNANHGEINVPTQRQVGRYIIRGTPYKLIHF